MRILFTFAGGSGHFHPLIPIARAARAAGHAVAVSGGPAMTAGIEAAGFTAYPSAGRAAGPRKRGPLLEPDTEREERVIRDYFATRLARQRADSLLAVCGRWRPDLLVCDETDFGGMIVAEGLGLPHASVIVIAAGGLVRPELISEPLRGLRAEHGLPAEPVTDMLHRDLVIAPLPPSFRDPAHPLPPGAHPVRPVLTAGDPPGWSAAPSGAPMVYFTLGTEFNVEAGDLFHRVLAGLRELPVTVLVTVGHDIDPAEFGSQPANVRVERYVAQAELLPRCAAVVSHGGSGSVLGALAYGVPLVLLPMGADQPHNARRCADLGVGRVLDPVRATPEEVRDAVAHVLGEPGYRRAARRLEREASVMPDPASAVRALESLVTG